MWVNWKKKVVDHNSDSEKSEKLSTRQKKRLKESKEKDFESDKEVEIRNSNEYWNIGAEDRDKEKEEETKEAQHFNN